MQNIIKALQSGEGEAFSEIMTQYKPLVEASVSALVSKVGNMPSTEYDDIRQEAYIALYSAACSYDTEQDKITFGLYAKICIKNRLISYLRRNVYVDFISDEIPIGDEVDPEQGVINAEQYEKLNEYIDSKLTEYEKSVFKLYLADMSYADIAKRLSKNEKSVDNAIRRIKKKLLEWRS